MRTLVSVCFFLSEFIHKTLMYFLDLYNCICVSVFVCVRARVCLCACVCVCIYICVYVCVCMPIRHSGTVVREPDSQLVRQWLPEGVSRLKIAMYNVTTLLRDDQM